jgi:DnaK suppressor protein
MDHDTATRLLHGERRRVERVLRDLDAADPDELNDYQREHNEQLRAQLQSELEAVERAEARLADGTYGLSIESGKAIPEGRLHTFPTAERTEDEQLRYEKQRGEAEPDLD